MKKFSELIEAKIKIKKEKYSWGELIVIEVGSMFKVVMHPEHLKMIRSLKPGGKGTFTDEQNKTWGVARSEEIGGATALTFKTRGNQKLSIPFEDIT
jgi:hypothetical protein